MSAERIHSGGLLAGRHALSTMNATETISPDDTTEERTRQTCPQCAAATANVHGIVTCTVCAWVAR